MKLVIQMVLLALAFLGGMALERRANKVTEAEEGNDSSVVATAPGLGLERGVDEREVDRHEQDQAKEETKGTPSLSYLLNLSEERDRHRALDNVPPSEMIAMLEELRESDDQSPQARALKRVLYDRWAHDQPLAALQHALAHETNSRIKEHVIHNAFGQLAERDINGALEAYSGLESRRHREEAISAIAHRSSLENLPMLAEFFTNGVPNAPSEALFRVWAERDSNAGILDLAKAAGSRAVRAAMEGMAMSDPEGALRMAQELGPEAMRVALGALSHTDPTFAARELASLPLGRQRNDLAREIAHRLAQEDVHAALEWTESLDASAQRGALEELTREWARQDPHSAGEFALSLEDGDRRREAISEVAHRLAQADPGTALDWVNQLEGENALSAMRGVVNTVADTDPNAAADLIAQIGPSEAYNEMAGDFAAHWSEFNPQAAAEWTQSLPAESEAQHHATERVAGHWVEQDVSAAAEWIGDLPQGELRDVAAGRLVEHLAPSDPDAAFQWALSLNDPGHQTEMLHEVIEQWQDVDPQAAQATLNSATLSSQQREELGELFQGPN